MKHQKKAFKWALPLARIALFMEMRLGKSLVAIRWAERNKCRRVLIVSPLAVMRSWQRELQRERFADSDIEMLRGTPEQRMQLAQTNATWFLVSYESLLWYEDVLKLPWDCIILDESTKFRNPKADITKVLKRYIDRFGYRAVLSGMPAPESVLDYYEQMWMLYGNFMGCQSFWHFRAKYFSPQGYGGHDWVCNSFVHKKIQDEVGRLAFVMSRKEAGIGSKKLREVITVEENEEQRRLREQIDEGFEWSIAGEEVVETKWVPVKYVWMGMVAGGFRPDGTCISNGKVNAILHLLKGELKNEKVVIWFKHSWEIAHVAGVLREKGISAVCFTGEDQKGEDGFKFGTVRVICAQGKCGQYGLDWSIASTEIYYSNWFDGEVRAQTEDRIEHPLKKDPLLVIDLVTENTVDEEVVSLLGRKRYRSKEFTEELARRWATR